MATDSFDWYTRRYEPLLASPPTSFELETESQDQCPLFSLLPAELRLMIFEYTLTDYESSDYFYDSDNSTTDHQNHSYIRPDYRPRRSTFTQLLRTCQRVYSETWLMPFIFAEHIFYAGSRQHGTNEDVRQHTTIAYPRMLEYLMALNDYTYTCNRTFHIPHIEEVRIYFHSCKERAAYPLSYWFIPREFGPRCFTFSFSYKNSWMKNRYGYNLSAEWVNKTRFPISVTRIRMELGKFSDDPQLREIVSEVTSKWFFRREDGVVFRAAEGDVFYRRWEVNEASNAQAQAMERVYVIPMVTWRPAAGFDPFTDGYECPDLNLTSLARLMDRFPLSNITAAYV